MKAAKGKQDPRLNRFTAACLALPEATFEHTGQHGVYKVAKKVFAYYLDDHHGDGRVAIHRKAPPGENERLAKKDPKRFFIPAYVGPKGWMALRLGLGRIDWEEVAGFAARSYALIAPKKLAAQVLGTATAKAKPKKKT